VWFAEWVSIPGMGGLAVVHVQDEPVRCCLGSDQAQGLNRRRGSRGSWFQFLLQAQALRPTPCNLPVDACLHSLLATNHPRHATCDRSNSRMPAGNAIAIHHCAPNCSVLGCLPAIFFRDRAGMRRTPSPKQYGQGELAHCFMSFSSGPVSTLQPTVKNVLCPPSAVGSVVRREAECLTPVVPFQ